MLGVIKLRAHGEISMVPSTRISRECTNSKPVARKFGISKTKQNQKRQETMEEGYRKSRTNHFLDEDDKTIPNISIIPKIGYLSIKKIVKLASSLKI